MQAVTGVFSSQSDAQRTVNALRSTGLSSDRITLLTPGDAQSKVGSIPVDDTEQPGMGKAIGAVVGAAGGLSGGSLLVALIPGVGPVTALGLLGGAVLAAAGAAVGASVGGRFENSVSEGLPEDEIFVYEDALRKGRSVVIVMAADEAAAAPIRELLRTEGAESIDAARHEWWTGLRSAEREHYVSSGRNFSEDEKFYRLGFEDALHSRWRCREFDQVSQEMANRVEDLEREHPGAKVEEPYTRGYQRGREYYQRLCDETKAA
jgi:hypothetical protein